MDSRLKNCVKPYDLTSCCVKLEQLNTVCRACLRDRDLRNMFDVHYYDGKPEIYPEIVFSCFNIEVISNSNDINDTCMICDNCILRLRDAYAFKKQIESSLKLFEQHLELSILKDSDENINDLNFFGDETFLNESDDESYNLKVVRKKSKHSHKRTHRISPKSKLKLKLKCPSDYGNVEFMELNGYDIDNQDICKDTEETLDNDSIKIEQKLEDIVKNESHDNETFLNEKYGTNSSQKIKGKKIPKPYKLDKNDITCKICNETFPLHSNLVRHLSVHYPNFICDVCGGVFSARGKLKAHILRHSNNRESCPICNKSYKCRDNLKKHIKHHSDPRPIYKCPKCPQRFNVYYQRMKHLVHVHNDEPKKYKCKQCPKQYFVAGGLRRHIKRDHLQERNSICPVCGSAFFNKHGLNEHMLKHTGIKNFQCKVCHKSFGRKYTLTEHMKIHNNEKRFECPVCNRRFTQKCTLTGHMNTHKKIEDLPNSQANNLI